METTVNQRISEIIKMKGLNKNSFAVKIGISGQTIHNIVSGRHNKPSFEVLDKIMSAFEDINPSWLMTGEGEMHKNGLGGPLLSRQPADNGQYGSEVVARLQRENSDLKSELLKAKDEIIALLKRNGGKRKGASALTALGRPYRRQIFPSFHQRKLAMRIAS